MRRYDLEEGGLMQGVAVLPSGGGVRRLFDEEGGLMQGVAGFSSELGVIRSMRRAV